MSSSFTRVKISSLVKTSFFIFEVADSFFLSTLLLFISVQKDGCAVISAEEWLGSTSVCLVLTYIPMVIRYTRY